MKYLKRLLRVAAVFLLVNLGLLEWLWPLPAAAHWPLLAALAAFYLYSHIRPRHAPGASRRLRVMIGGYELLAVSFWVIFAQTALYVALLCAPALPTDPGAPRWLLLAADTLLFLPLVGALLLNGFVRVALTSQHLRIVWRVLLVCLWWAPVFNIYLFWRVLRTVRSEYYFERARMDAEAAHAENEDCKTRYPIVLVHGIFFRDWQLLGYWGRIPAALQRCGAQIEYGGQQSALPVAQSGEELAVRLREILRKTGAEKVNIIAHSKGGLDSRWAISKLGLAPHVASLTTINTPHRGCVFAQHLLRVLPQGFVQWVARRYNRLFHALGDISPDFLGGVRDLTRESCLAFNRQVPDVPGVLYQSVMSTMRRASSAGFPLNFTWRLVKKYDKEPNDGLVALSSAGWGNDLGCISVPGKRGVSHGDMIDLMREDVPGFDVREFYIRLVKDLKARGL